MLATRDGLYLSLTFLTLLAMSLTAHATDADQQFAAFKGCTLKSGQAIVDCRIGYRTFGTLNPDRSNGVLVTTWLSGISAEMVPLVETGGIRSGSRLRDRRRCTGQRRVVVTLQQRRNAW